MECNIIIVDSYNEKRIKLNSMKEGSDLWLQEANWDLENAEILYRNKRYSTAVFQSQQAAEKAVNALLMNQNLNGWGHSISKLLEKYNEFSNREVSSIIKEALKLDKHYIPTRYPDSLPGIAPHEAYTIEEAEQAIDQAKRIIEYTIIEMDFFKKQEIQQENKENDEGSESN